MNVEMIPMSENRAIGVASSKLILVGEHAVVHGQPAIALPFPLIKVESSVQEIEGPIRLESELYNGLLDEAPTQLSGIVQTIKETLICLRVPAENLLIQIHSTIPPGKGLGSSASVAIAIVRSLFHYTNTPYTNDQLLKLANIAETYAHGAPSGIDSITITSSSPVWYQKEASVDYIEPKGTFYFVVADTGMMADTKSSVANVKELLKTAPEKMYGAVERIGEITYQVREALEKSSKKVLGYLLNEAQHELELLGVSNEGLERLIQFARKEGALGAKLTGAGKGGCMIALAQNELHSKQLSEKLKQFGAQAVWPFVLKNEHIE